MIKSYIRKTPPEGLRHEPQKALTEGLLRRKFQIASDNHKNRGMKCILYMKHVPNVFTLDKCGYFFRCSFVFSLYIFILVGVYSILDFCFGHGFTLT